MSGIYIPGMEMPKNCCECPLTYYEDGTCIFTGIEALSIGVQKDCPLAPVPEHGDLIDRDKLEKDIDNYIGGEESRSRFHHWVQVQNAVIPMDKGEEK